MFFQVNVRTAMSVGQASGGAGRGRGRGCEVVQYTPNQVKEAVAGWVGAQGAGAADGAGAVGAGRPPRPADAADAAALALCHLAIARGRMADRIGAAPMIGSLRGTVLERARHGELLVEVGGVGYRVHVTPRPWPSWRARRRGVPPHPPPHPGGRPDALRLPSRDERDMFETLLGTHGVGPALALAILAVTRRGAGSPSPTDDLAPCASCPASARRRPRVSWSS